MYQKIIPISIHYKQTGVNVVNFPDLIKGLKYL